MMDIYDSFVMGIPVRFSPYAPITPTPIEMCGGSMIVALDKGHLLWWLSEVEQNLLEA